MLLVGSITLAIGPRGCSDLAIDEITRIREASQTVLHSSEHCGMDYYVGLTCIFKVYKRMQPKAAHQDEIGNWTPVNY
ncbi:hypothetical protein DPMN_164386 [Dreissena polymorpha]|uniref:Uncharacterized protein n=1 Tax=Dreissena polymorpha TaxID=45954 RepID=A0A9D4ETL9_DREPO|nr:hypothetical protein DPMN_164386 [Dreissena polymorpha]